MTMTFKLRCWSAIVMLTLALALNYATAQSMPKQALTGWQLFHEDRFLPAAEAWSQAANASAQRRNAAGQRAAAFTSVLAAIAYEQAGDERAYVRWADAIRMYLEAGLTWERERDSLRMRWSTLEHQLAQASVGAAPTLRADEQMLADLVKRVNLTGYNGPRAGLRDRRDDAANVSTITPQYFVGASLDDSINDVQVPQSRYAAVAPTPTASNAPDAVQIAGRPIAGPLPQAAMRTYALAATAPPATEMDQPVVVAQPYSPQLARGRPMMTDSPATSPPDPALAQPTASMPRQFRIGPATGHMLSNAERATALQAWSYVLANRQSSTGLVNGKNDYPVSSVADMAQTIAAYTSALALQFIERESFESDMRQLLGTLHELPLYNSELFNRDYDSRSGRMLDLGAHSSEIGGGWAAEDIGRLLLWLRVLGNTAPDLAPATEDVVARLRLSRLVSDGQLYSVLNQDGREQVVGDLRLGRQQVTAAALTLWGVVLPAMLNYDDAVIRRIGTVTAPGDRRDGAVSPDVFARGIIELGGIDGCFEAAAHKLLDAQHALAERQRRPVMVADEFLDRTPWFVSSTLASSGEEWHVNSLDQQRQPALANFSLKAAHLWWAVDRAPQTLLAHGLADSLERSKHGLYGGRYEHGQLSGQLNGALTLDTNASVLLAAHYVQRRQPMLRVDNPIAFACPGLRAVAR